MKWTREEYIELMTFGDAPRPMFSELFGPLIGLDAEWREQGASEEEIMMPAFDWDYVPYVDCGGDCGPFGTPEPIVLEETSEYLVQRDYLGRTAKLCKATATLPLPLDFPVKTMDDWESFKPYYMDNPRRAATAIDAAKLVTTYDPATSAKAIQKIGATRAARNVPNSASTNSAGTNCRGCICRGCFCITRTFHIPYWKYWPHNERRVPRP